MARSKKKTKKSKKLKKPTRAKSAPKRTATKKPRKKTTKPTKKASSAKKVAAKRKPRRPAPRRALPRAAKTFAEKVRDCDAGTGIWFIVAGSVEHAAIQEQGSDGAVVIRTDAGVTEVVPLANLFETADEARAARYR